MHLFYAIIPFMVAGLVLLPSTFLLRSSLANLMIQSQWGYTKVPGFIMAKQRNRSQVIKKQAFTLYAYKFQYKYNQRSFIGVQFLWEADSKPAFKTSQKITVEFSRFLPRFSRIFGLKQVDSGSYTALSIVTFVILSLLAMSLYWVNRGLKPKRQRRKIYEKGLVAPAKLVLVDNHPDVVVSGQNPVRLHWTYTIQEQEYKGSYWSMRMSEIQEITKLGEDVFVLYDPQKPELSIPFLPEETSNPTTDTE